jgi:hypothetical protein
MPSQRERKPVAGRSVGAVLVFAFRKRTSTGIEEYYFAFDENRREEFLAILQRMADNPDIDFGPADLAAARQRIGEMQ